MHTLIFRWKILLGRAGKINYIVLGGISPENHTLCDFSGILELERRKVPFNRTEIHVKVSGKKKKTPHQAIFTFTSEEPAQEIYLQSIVRCSERNTRKLCKALFFMYTLKTIGILSWTKVNHRGILCKFNAVLKERDLKKN